MPTEFLSKVSSLREKTDEIMGRVLPAGAEVVADKVRSNLESAIGKGTKRESRSTGELVKALGVSGVRVDRDGNHNVKVGFAKSRPDGARNGLIAGVLEHGKSGQAPRPFLRPAKSQSRKACVDAMTAKLEEEIGKI
jgi:HK97 gp10 family phage protein